MRRSRRRYVKLKAHLCLLFCICNRSRYFYLRRADLRCADLRRADLRRADPRCADLRRADLRRVDLWRADLKREAAASAGVHEGVSGGSMSSACR